MPTEWPPSIGDRVRAYGRSESSAYVGTVSDIWEWKGRTLYRVVSYDSKGPGINDATWELCDLERID